MIGIIAAMEVEAELLIASMTDSTSKTISGIAFHTGKLWGKDAVVAVCGIGKVNAAMCAQTMILSFNPSLIINTGVAGGYAGVGLKVGDVVVATDVVQHDFDLSPLGESTPHFPCDKDIIEVMCKGEPLSSPAIRTGIIATGDQFISSSEKAAEINGKFGAIAFEMEGGSIGQVCHVNGVRFTVIRAISDNGDDNANVDFPTFTKLAAERSAGILKTFIKEDTK